MEYHESKYSICPFCKRRITLDQKCIEITVNGDDKHLFHSYCWQVFKATYVKGKEDEDE